MNYNLYLIKYYLYFIILKNLKILKNRKKFRSIISENSKSIISLK